MHVAETSPWSALPPGPTEPSVLQLVRLIRDPIAFHDDCLRRYGDVYTFRLPAQPPIVSFARADGAREIFAGPPEVMCAGEANQSLEFLVGRHSLMRLDGERHRLERKLMMPVMHGERMVLYGAQIRAITDDVIGRFRQGQPIDVQEVMQEITLRVVLETIFGMTPGPRHDRLKHVVADFLREAVKPPVTIGSYVVGGHRFSHFLTERLAPVVDRAKVLDGLPFAAVARSLRDLNRAIYEEIEERRAVAAGRSDVMSMLIEAKGDDGEALSDEELRDEVIALLVAGHESTATTLTWATALSLADPSVSAGLRDEYERVFADGPFDPRKAADLKYTDAVCREALRLYPVAPGVGRVLKRPTTIAGHALPAGVVVAISAYQIHCDPSIWPNPLYFDPTRFLDRKPRPGDWLPFGGGARTCIGMAFAFYEMRVVLSTLFRRAALRLTAPVPQLAMRGLMLGPQVPIRVQVDAVDPPVHRAPPARAPLTTPIAIQ